MSVVQGSMTVRFARNVAVEAAPLKDESVLFNPKTNKFCLLNRTMAFIWARVDQAGTPEQISEEICRSFRGVSETQARTDVDLALHEMLELGLLVKLDA